MKKTNAMRILDSNKIKYDVHDYTDSGAVSGMDVAKALNEDERKAFKTLVTHGKGEYYVFVVPVNKELDLKKAAAASGEKKIEMLPQKELLPLTGYIHGGCSPIGMKKLFKTFIDASAKEFDRMFVSGGKVGMQVEIAPNDLIDLIKGEFYPVTKEE